MTKNDTQKTEKLDLKKQNELLIQLCQSQHETLNYINNLMASVVRSQRELQKQNLDKYAAHLSSETDEEIHKNEFKECFHAGVNNELLDIAWYTNDVILDNPEQQQLFKLLHNECSDNLKGANKQ